MSMMDEDEELKRIREKKAKKLMEMAQERKRRMEDLKESQESPKNITDEDKFQLMEYFLTPEAFQYWKQLYELANKRDTAETIFINLLYLVKIGFMEGKQISRLGIKKLERKIDNIPSTITIKRKGEKEHSRTLD